jgi:hypothetical protein
MGDYMTNASLVDIIPYAAYHLKLDNVQFYSIPVCGYYSVLAKTYDNQLANYNYGIIDVDGSTVGLHFFLSYSGLLNHYDFMYGGTVFHGDAGQMNMDNSQYGPTLTTNLTSFGISINSAAYGVPFLQRGIPDYLSMIVRSNSIGSGVSNPPYESTWSPTNSVPYWVRFLQSDYPGNVTQDPVTHSFNIEANYTVDQMTVRSNLLINGRNLSSLNDSLLDGCISYVPGYITNGLVLDASIYDNNYVNSGLTSTNGLIGYGIQNSNADFANMSYAAATNYPYDLSNSWSADVWFKTTTPQSAYSTPLWSKQVGNSNDYALWLGIASSNQVLSISTESDGTLLGGLLNTQNAFTDNQWHYLAETYNLQTGTRTVFYDGSIVGTTNITLPVKYENQSITFGGVAATNVQTDEAHLWNRALSSNEIYSIFINGGTATPNTFIGTFTGNGSLLTNLNASNLTSGTLPDAAVSPNTMTNLYGTNTGPAVAYVANHTWAINTNTAAGATFYASTNGFIMSATAAVTNLAIITSPSGKTNFWQVSGYVQINSTVTDTAKMVVLYKDENNAWQSNGMSAVYSGTGANDVAAQGIWVQPSTPIYIVITLPTTGGTINYNAATHVEMKP